MNSSNLTQAIDQLKREIQKENGDLAQKQAALQTATAERQKLEIVIKKEPELKQKEVEIQKLKVEIQQAKSKIQEVDRNIHKHTDEVNKIKQEQSKKNSELLKVQQEYQSAIKNVKK